MKKSERDGGRTTAAAVTLTAPEAGATVSGTVTVSAAAVGIEVASVRFQLDGVSLGAEVTTAPYELAWDTATVASGAHSLTAVARDRKSVV